MKTRITRRQFLHLAASGAGIGLLAACGATPTPTATPVPTKPPAPTNTPAPAPAAPTATKPPAPTNTPVPPAPTAAATGNKGGMLRIAYQGDPPTLDVHWTTTYSTSWIGLHVFESLFSYDAKWAPVPELAASYVQSADGLTHTIQLRKGVTFHNGKEMVAEDVDASIRRWGKLAGPGKSLFAVLDTITSPDKYTLVFKLKSVYPLFDQSLATATQGAVIYPKEVVDEAAAGEVKQYIGTGPYKLAEWQRDRFVRLTRYDNYASYGDKPNGLSGKKLAYLDEIRYVVVTDPSVRLSSLLSGDADYVQNPSMDQYNQLKTDKRVKTFVVGKWDLSEVIINLKSAITSDQKLRQAILAATDCEPCLLGRYINKEFIRLSPSLMADETRWYTDVGKEFYNQKSADKAKALLAQSKYKGETLRWLTTKEFAGFYEQALVHSQQLQAVGINVSLQVTDWATVVATRAKPEAWELFTSGWGPFLDPMLSSQFLGTFIGWWQTDKSDALRKTMLAETDFAKRYAAWQELQKVWYDEVPCINYGHGANYDAMNPKLNDVNANWVTLAFWNSWLSK